MAKTQPNGGDARLAQQQKLALFLIDLAIDPDKREAFESNPEAAMAEAELTPEPASRPSSPATRTRSANSS